MLFIGPPFGNYLSLPQTKSIAGSFTINERPGLYSQIYKTLYFSYKHNGWVNKIGLRNKGIDWALKNVSKDKVLSISILDENDIDLFLKKIPENRDIEINISCPNVDNKLIHNNIYKFLNNQREWCILKISPTMPNKDIHNFYNLGFRQFHCCNTLPVEDGGLSGPSIIPYTNNKIKFINQLKDTTIIAGGGIRKINDLNKYNDLGASHFSISTICFNPYLLSCFYLNYIFKNHN